MGSSSTGGAPLIISLEDPAFYTSCLGNSSSVNANEIKSLLLIYFSPAYILIHL